MTENFIDYDRDANGVAWIMLNRPEKKNAMNRAFLDQLQAVYKVYESDDQARCAVIMGAGETFSTGGDISMFPAINAEVGLDFTYENGQKHYQFLDTLNKPVIAAVHGYCLAGGFELALQCTFILASESAIFGMEEARLGLIPGYGGTVRLLTGTSPRIGLELLLSARRIGAQEAKGYGLVNEITPDRETLKTLAGEKAALIASMSPNSIAAILHVNRTLNMQLANAFDTEALRTALLFGNADTQNRIQSILDRLQKK